MRAPLVSLADLLPERLATALVQRCEREGLDPYQTACVIVEVLTWAPDLPRRPKALPHSAHLGHLKAQTIDRPEMIRQRAHEIWLAEGQPEGQALEHWRRAEAEVAHGTRASD